MEKILLVLIAFSLFLPHTVAAIPNPAPVYCTGMGYAVSGEYCVFPDGGRCGLWAFYNGECGQEYVKELPCVEAGGSLVPGHECCGGLIPISKSTPGPHDTCAEIVGAWSVCAPCGDGVCERELENSCNCPGDCGGCPERCPSISPPYCPGGYLIGQGLDECGCRLPSTCCGNGVCEGNEREEACRDCVDERPKKICIDSDGGKNYYVKGTVKVEGLDVMAIDSCLMSHRMEGDEGGRSAPLVEMYCKKDGTVGSEQYACPKGCVDGACIKDGCQSDSDCELFFSHCSCSWTCVEKSDQPRRDCKRACPDEETDRSVNGCKCDEGKCVPATQEPKPQDKPCDPCNPCSGGLTCINFPETGKRCAKPDPCSYYQCPSNTECKVAQTMIATACPDGTITGPVPSLRCECVGPDCPDTGGGDVVSYDLETKTETIIHVKKGGETEAHSITLHEAVPGSKGLLETDTASAVYSNELIVEDARLYMETSAGRKPINTLPEEAVSVSETPAVESVKGVELKEESQKPVYSVKGIKKARILFILPVTVAIETKVDAETGTIVSVKKPWWALLAW